MSNTQFKYRHECKDVFGMDMITVTLLIEADEVMKASFQRNELEPKNQALTIARELKRKYLLRVEQEAKSVTMNYKKMFEEDERIKEEREREALKLKFEDAGITDWEEILYGSDGQEIGRKSSNS